ncbi:uncharacterized protein LOC107042265 [Diachasma alloeum]|uniref:uncharacterized protein LOC107042265 n=1 Tax=Diachasma alloeum TaxID=454923 RepID=UPI0007384F56|nr:uncharacterized protein LOC107042265 [Diachasma alloeum]
MIDTGLNFKQKAVHVAMKASTVGSLLSRLMPNVGGPKQTRRALLTSVTMSVLMYDIVIWADALSLQESRRRMSPVYRLSVLRVACAFRTVSDDAVCVIAGMIPIGILAQVRRSLYQQKGSASLRPAELKAEERRKSMEK